MKILDSHVIDLRPFPEWDSQFWEVATIELENGDQIAPLYGRVAPSPFLSTGGGPSLRAKRRVDSFGRVIGDWQLESVTVDGRPAKLVGSNWKAEEERATMLQRRKIRVRGKGIFPLDMLRCDGLSPLSEEGANKIAESIAVGDEDLSVDVLLVGNKAGNWTPTVDRWRSFGFEVVRVES